MDIVVSYKDANGNSTEPLPHQEDYHLYTGWAKHHLLAGSLGTGKSEAMCMEAIHQCATYDNNLGLLGRKVLDAFKKSTLIQLLDVAGDFVLKHKAQDREIIFKNGSKIVYMALDDSRDSIQRIKSMNLGFFAFDQLEEVSEDTFMAAGGQLRRKGTMRVSFHTCNPSGHDWVWKRWKKEKEKNNAVKGGYRLIETKTWQEGADSPTSQEEVRVYSDNPYLPYDYIQFLLEMPQKWVNRYVYCGWDDFEGLVYSMWDRKKHLIPQFDIPKWWNRYIIYDYGYKNPSAILFAAVDDEGFIYVYDLIYKSETLIEELALLIDERLEGDCSYEFISDPSILRTERDGNSVADEWLDFGYDWNKANNDKKSGFDRVARYLSEDKNGYIKLKFFDIPQMQSLVDEIEKYKWKELKFGKDVKTTPEEPIKKDDHALDCIRYLVHEIEDSSEPTLEEEGWLPVFSPKKETSWMGT